MKNCVLHSFWVLTFMIINLTQQQYFESPLGKYISDYNYTKVFEQSQELIGILFTNKHCQECYYSQRQLIEIISKIDSSEKVAIYRCELSTNEQLQEEFYIKRYPMLHFVFPKQKNQQKRHTALSSISSFPIYLMSKVLTLEAALETVRKLKYYLSPLDTYPTKQKIFIKGGSFFWSQQEISTLYGMNYLYQELPLLIFKDQEQFKSLLGSEGLSGEQVQYCILYIWHHRKCIKPEENSQNLIQQTLQLMVLEKVNQFTEHLYKHYQAALGQRYLFIAVIDSILQRKQSQELVSMLNKVLQRRELMGISIFWMQTQINKQKLQHLGFQINDRAPLLALFDLKTKEKRTYGNKKGDIFEEEHIVKFIKSVIKIDEQRLLTTWNEELLKQTLSRLGFTRKIDFLPPNSQIENVQIPTFILYISYASIPSLDNKQLFYQKILSFNYFTKRVKRFSNVRKIRKAISFKWEKQCRSGNCGLEVIHNKQRRKITSKELFNVEDISEKASVYLKNKFDLPEHYWVNEDLFSQFLQKEGSKFPKPDFQHVLIQI